MNQESNESSKYIKSFRQENGSSIFISVEDLVNVWKKNHSMNQS